MGSCPLWLKESLPFVAIFCSRFGIYSRVKMPYIVSCTLFSSAEVLTLPGSFLLNSMNHEATSKQLQQCGCAGLTPSCSKGSRAPCEGRVPAVGGHAAVKDSLPFFFRLFSSNSQAIIIFTPFDLNSDVIGIRTVCHLFLSQ